MLHGDRATGALRGTHGTVAPLGPHGVTVTFVTPGPATFDQGPQPVSDPATQVPELHPRTIPL